MKRLDLIIEFCESMANMHVKGSVHALAAARELRTELAKPVNEFHPDWDTLQPFHDRIAELEAQLSKPKQEPVAWLYNGHLHECDPSDWAEEEVTPLYTAPPKREWVGLTDEEVHKIVDRHTPNEASQEELNDFVLAVYAAEAKLREKNT